MNTVQRFSDRVENYVKYRPGYPAPVLDLFRREMGLTEHSVIADIGSGPGISARPFLENGNQVYCVEPNNAMRLAAERILAEFPSFVSVDGTAEATTLPDDSVDLIIAAQAFHWFDPEPTRAEFKRILRPEGYVSLIWNERELNATEFLAEYEKFLLKYGNDYEKVRHENIDEAALSGFFGTLFHRASFPNEQVLDFEGLKGRLLSSSYMPGEDDPRSHAMIEELRTLFAKFAVDDKIKLLYSTNIFFTRF